MSDFKKSYKRYLDTVGIDTFIKYFEYFKHDTENQKMFEIFEHNNESWNKNAYSVKSSSGKRIFRLGIEVEALKYIANDANPNKIGIEVKEQAVRILNDIENLNIKQEFNYIDKSAQKADLSSIEKQILIKYRIGQSSYRRKLLEYWGGCSVSGCSNISVLIASHIKQYSICLDKEKYDVFNGLLLTPNYDKLFDAYLISFDEFGKILISENLIIEDLEKLGVSKSDRLLKNKLTQEHVVYLKEHRQKFYDINLGT